MDQASSRLEEMVDSQLIARMESLIDSKSARWYCRQFGWKVGREMVTEIVL